MNTPPDFSANNRQAAFGDENPRKQWIGQRCTKLESSARMVDAMITNTMLPEIGREFLSRLAASNENKKVHLSAKEGNFAYAFD